MSSVGERTTGGHAVIERVPALDGLRGVAVAVVLWFHAGHLEGGYLGVDLFFTLSGYLITSLLVIEWRGSGHIRLGAFWGRRVRRLMPALVVMLVAVGLVARYRILPAARGDLRDAGLATLGYVANWQAILGGNGYWEQTLTPSWLEHTWSLAIEEQFYLLWPIVVVAVLAAGRRFTRVGGRLRSRQRRVRLLGTVALIGAVVSGGGMIVGSLAGASVERLYLGTDTRVAAILLGAAASCYQRADGKVATVEGHARTLLTGASVAALGFLALMWVNLEGTSPILYRGGLFVCGLAAVIIVLDISTPGRSLVGAVLSVAPLRALGAISYGLYLYHWPIYRFLGEADLGLRGWWLTVARLVMSLMAAVLSYHFIEQPILQRRWSWPAVRLAPVGVAAAVVALLVGSIGAVDVAPASQDDVTRPDLEALGPRQAADRVAVPAEEQAAAPAGDDAVPVPEVRTERLVDPVVLFVGDSVALSLAEEGFVPQQDQLGLAVVNGGFIGCTIVRDTGAPPTPGAEFLNDCSPMWPDLVARYQPDVVVLQFGAFAGISPVPVDGQDRFPCTPQYDRRWRERLNEAVDVLSSTGAVVDLVTAPTSVIPPEDKPTFDARMDCVNGVITDVADARPGVQTIELAEWLCPEDQCRGNVEGVDLRNDGLHYRDAGAIVVARWMAPHILEVEVDG